MITARRRPTTALILAIAAVLSWGEAAAAHPQDGPHCDLRLVVSERAVTWNIGLNLAFADELVGPLRESPDILAPVEEPALREALLEHFGSENRVIINGKERDHIVREFTVGRVDDALLPLFPRVGRLALTRFVCVLEYPAPDGVDTLEVTWRGYPIDVLSEEFEPSASPSPMAIEAQLQADGRVEIVRFLKSQPTVEWDALGADPAEALADVPHPPDPVRAQGGTPLGFVLYAGIGAVAVGLGLSVSTKRMRIGGLLAGVGVVATVLAILSPASQPGSASPIDGAYAHSVVTPLLANAYEAFAHTDESVIYDLLERSASGEVLDRLYREVYSAMVVSDHDRGRAIVSGVDVRGVRLAEAPDGLTHFAADAEWEATGSIYHWGHSHQRTYAYKARLTLAAIDDAWKIVGLTITDQERLGEDDGPDPYLPEGFEL